MKPLLVLDETRLDTRIRLRLRRDGFAIDMACPDCGERVSHGILHLGCDDRLNRRLEAMTRR